MQPEIPTSHAQGYPLFSALPPLLPASSQDPLDPPPPLAVSTERTQGCWEETFKGRQPILSTLLFSWEKQFAGCSANGSGCLLCKTPEEFQTNSSIFELPSVVSATARAHAREASPGAVMCVCACACVYMCVSACMCTCVCACAGSGHRVTVGKSEFRLRACDSVTSWALEQRHQAPCAPSWART